MFSEWNALAYYAKVDVFMIVLRLMTKMGEILSHFYVPGPLP